MSIIYHSEKELVNICPYCDVEGKVELSAKHHTFQYGTDDDPNKFDVSCVIPVNTCLTCEAMWTDMNAEVIQDLAVKEALKAREAERVKSI